MKKTIGIIGGGAGGLCALKHLISHEQYLPVLWEQGNEVGGTWIYTPNIGKDEYGNPIHSSMYKNLLTNLPKEIMAFPDFPFKGEKSFVHHTEVLQYLRDYADHFNLKPLIKFNHRVEMVEPIDENNRLTKWRISVKNLKDGTLSVSEFDGVFVCNGHYFAPRYPDIENLEIFKGKKMHSHSYRVPDEYSGTKTVILGASASGLDISLEVAKVAEKVYLSHNHPIPFPSKLPDNVFQVSGVKRAKENGFVLRNDSFVEADAIMYCTGYEYTFPFLSSSCNIQVEDNQVKTLYKHMINASFPTMGFVGIPFQILPFPVFDVQVRYMINALCGKLLLPDKEVMEKDTRSEFESKISEGHPSRYFHKMGHSQWKYVDELAQEADLVPLPPVISKIYLNCHNLRRTSLMIYKTNIYTLTKDGSFISSLGGTDSEPVCNI